MSNLDELLQIEISKLFGVTRMSINRWTREGLPRNKNGTYPGAACVSWLLSRIEDRALAKAESGGESEESLKWLGEFRKQRALIATIERKKLEGEVVQWSEVEAEWAGRVRELTSGLTSFADRLAGLIAGKDRGKAHEIIRVEVRTLMENYSRDGKYSPEV